LRLQLRPARPHYARLLRNACEGLYCESRAKPPRRLFVRSLQLVCAQVVARSLSGGLFCLLDWLIAKPIAAQMFRREHFSEWKLRYKDRILFKRVAVKCLRRLQQVPTAV
jgi:hypothetical protein